MDCKNSEYFGIIKDFSNLFAVVVVDYDTQFHVGQESLQLVDKLAAERLLVVDSEVGDNIHGDKVLLFEVVKTVNLFNFLVLSRVDDVVCT